MMAHTPALMSGQCSVALNEVCVGSHSQYSHTHCDPDSKFLAKLQLQTPYQLPWYKRKCKVGEGAPRGVEDAEIDGDRGVPTCSFDAGVPGLCSWSALEPL